MSYYKYAEQDASTQLNWAEIGKNVTDMLQQEVKVREEKKAVIDENTRNYGNYLNEAPQGKFQDANKFINDYVALQQQTRMMDDKMLKSGRMDLKTYTTRRQNGMDGTDQLFNLQKQFQSVHEERMKGIMDGTLTAQNAFEMMQVEGFGDFSKSQAMINPVDGRVNIGMTEVGEDGIRRVIKDSNIPVNVLMGKIQSELKTFDVNLATKSLVDSLGDRVLDLYRAGSISGMGSITELTGIDAIKKFGGSTWTEAATEMNGAIQKSIAGILSNPRNLPSLLTQNIGGYSSESFTYSREEAEKDSNKILLKAGFGPGEMDENGPNYAEQKAKAESWLTTSIKSQMDAKVSKKETNQVQLQETAEAREKAAAKYRPKTQEQKDMENADTATNMIGKLYYGDDNQVQSSIDYIKGLKNSKGEILFKEVVRDSTGVTVTLANGQKEKISFVDKNGKPRTQEDFIASAGPLLVNELDVSKSLKRGAYNKGASFNKSAQGRGATVEKVRLSTDIVSKPSQNAVENIQTSLPEGFTAEDTGTLNPLSDRMRNEVTITAPNGKKYVVETLKTDTKSNNNAATNIVIGLEDFINANLKESTGASGTGEVSKRIGSY